MNSLKICGGERTRGNIPARGYFGISIPRRTNAFMSAAPNNRHLSESPGSLCILCSPIPRVVASSMFSPIRGVKDV